MIISGLGVYRREEGEETNKYTATKAITKHNKAIRRAGCDLTQCYAIPRKGEPIRESIPGSGRLSDR